MRHRLILLSLLFAASPSFGQAAKATLRIGAILPLSGPMASYGEEVINGMEIGLEEIKKTDPDLASRIQILRLDDRSLATEAAKIAVKTFEERKADLIFGSLTSSATLAMIKAVTPMGKPVVAPTSTSADITRGGNYVFRTCYVDSFQGKVLAKFAVNDLKKQRAAILVEDTSEYSKAISREFQKTFIELGGTIVAEQSYKTGTTDFKKSLEEIRKKRPQLILVPGYYQEVARIMDQSETIGLHIPLLGGDGWESPNLYKLTTKNAIKGHYYASHFAADDKEESVQKFVTAFNDTYKRRPTMLAAMGYDGLLVIADAFKRAKGNLASSMISSLATTSGVQGVMGELKLNKERNAEKSAAIMQTTAEGSRFKTKIKADING